MSTPISEDPYWDEIRDHLREFHVHGQPILDEWKRDQDVFLRDIMNLCVASYTAGYDDAVDDAKEALQEQVHRVDELRESVDRELVRSVKEQAFKPIRHAVDSRVRYDDDAGQVLRVLPTERDKSDDYVVLWDNGAVGRVWGSDLVAETEGEK